MISEASRVRLWPFDTLEELQEYQRLCHFAEVAHRKAERMRLAHTRRQLARRTDSNALHRPTQ